MKRAIGLYLVVAAWAFWMGGFSFYFGVVVPTGGEVIGASEQGFVTQQVTHWLNVSGVAVLAILLGHAIAARNRFLLVTWAIMVAFQVALFVMHVQLDTMINVPARSVSDSARFGACHEWYEFVSALQWLCGMVHLGGVVQSATLRQA